MHNHAAIIIYCLCIIYICSYYAIRRHTYMYIYAYMHRMRRSSIVVRASQPYIVHIYVRYGHRTYICMHTFTAHSICCTYMYRTYIHVCIVSLLALVYIYICYDGAPCGGHTYGHIYTRRHARKHI